MKQHHHLIAETFAKLDGTLEHRLATNINEWALLRGRLIRALRADQLFKQVEVFDPLCARTADRRAGPAETMRTRYLALAAAVTSHFENNASGGLGDRSAQQEADRALIRRIRDHLTTEAAGIRSALAGLDMLFRGGPRDSAE